MTPHDGFQGAACADNTGADNNDFLLFQNPAPRFRRQIHRSGYAQKLPFLTPEKADFIQPTGIETKTKETGHANSSLAVRSPQVAAMTLETGWIALLSRVSPEIGGINCDLAVGLLTLAILIVTAYRQPRFDRRFNRWRHRWR
jgi:hypothetical protein